MKADGLRNLPYWERLERMKITSVGRRFERYKLIYAYKVINGYVDNCGLSSSYSDTSGKLIKPTNTSKFSHGLREQSFHYIAPHIFNALPRYLRDSVDTPANWKTQLDSFLNMTPDLPVTSEAAPGLCDPVTATASNSVLHWIPHLHLDDRRGRLDPQQWDRDSNNIIII